MLDVALIYFVALDRVPAFSLALLAVVFLYLPARDWIGGVLSRRNRLDEETLFDLVSRAALAAPGPDQQTGLERPELPEEDRPDGTVDQDERPQGEGQHASCQQGRAEVGEKDVTEGLEGVGAEVG